MKIYEAIKDIFENNNKLYKAVDKPYVLKFSSTGGISVLKQKGKEIKTNTFDLTGEHMGLEWEEQRKPVTSIEALSLKDKKIKPVGSYDFATAEEWLLNICDKRDLLKKLWEVE